MTLNNKFLTSFAELVSQKENKKVEIEILTYQLDIIIAIMEKVKLKKENYVALMRGVKIFVEDKAT